MTLIGLTYDMWAPTFAEVPLYEHYAAMLDQCEFADKGGVDLISFNEHHGTDVGYLPSPLLASAAVASRTKRVTIRPLLLAPLYDPLRLAEDIAILDNISGGRFYPMLGAGYRREEFEMFGRDRSKRRAAVDGLVEILRKAWTGEWFEYEGRQVRITPRPTSPGGPKIVLGGASPAAARAAARQADDFFPISPIFWPAYREECVKLGKPDPGPSGERSPMFVHISEDPDRVWPEIAPYLLNAIKQYRGWNEGQQDVPPQFAIDEETELRNSQFYRVLRPAEAVEMIQQLGPHGAFILRPMWGGYDPALGWESVRLLVEKVMPHIHPLAPNDGSQSPLSVEAS